MLGGFEGEREQEKRRLRYTSGNHRCVYSAGLITGLMFCGCVMERSQETLGFYPGDKPVDVTWDKCFSGFQ